MKKIVLSLCFVLALGACKDQKAKQPQKNTRESVTIGVMYPMSGDGAAFGEAAKNAANLFFEDFNKKPHQFDYKVIFEDNQFILSKQAPLVQKLIHANKADVLVSVMSNFGAVVSPIAEQNKVLHFSVSTDPAVADGFYNLITSSNPEGEVDLLYQKLIEKGAKKVDIVAANATGQQSMLDHFEQKVASEQNLNIGQVHHVNPDERDFRIMLYKIKENAPDYIVTFMAMPTIDVFMKQYQEQQTDIPVTGIESFTYLQNRGLAEGMWYIDAAPATDDYVKKYQAKTGTSTTDYAEYMDFILQMVTFGYEGAGTTDRAKVVEYIQKNSAGQNTAVGIISTAPDGILNGQPIVKIITEGDPVIVKE